MNAITLGVNKRQVQALAEPRMTLADFVRDGLDLTGTHLGCEHGVCGACTLLLDGVPARSCITYAVTCEGAEITTIEGLDDDEIMTELRAAFTREHALQCGYCTPGMLISARDLVLRLPTADEQRIRIGLSGNLCRCTGYVGIVRAVKSVIAERRARNIAPELDGGRKVLGPAGSGHAKCHDAFKNPVGHQGEKKQEINDSAVNRRIVADFVPVAVIEMSFEVAHPPEKVSEMFGDIAAVASCMPGVSLTAPPDHEQVEGALQVKMGPIAASFKGGAQVERDATGMSGRIRGAGDDQTSRSSAQGEVRYRLVPLAEEHATRVELSIGYSLKGMLAQIGRAGLVRELANRLVAEFASNLDKHLSGELSESKATVSTEFNAVAVVLGLLRTYAVDRLRSLFGKLR